MNHKAKVQELAQLLQDYLVSLTTRHGDVYIPPEHDNAYELKRALEHLCDCTACAYRAIDIAEFKFKY